MTGTCSDKDNHMHRVAKLFSTHIFVSLPNWKPLLNWSCGFNFSVGLTMAQAVSRRILTAGAGVQSHSSPCGICAGQSGSRTGFSPRISDISCQYYITNVPYSFINLPPTLYKVFLPAFQLPLSVSFLQCSILIHSSTTNAV